MRVDTRRGALVALGMLLAQAGSLHGAQSPPPRPGSARSPVPPASKALVDRFCDAIHALPAARKQACCGTTPSSLHAFCKEELGRSLLEGALALDAAEVDRCAQQQAAALEGCSWVTPRMPALPEACRGIVHGRVARGASCRSSLECQDGLSCRGAAPTRSGVCAPPSPARAGCEVPSDNLATFARAADGDARHPVCDGLCVKGQCLPLLAVGGRCKSSALCKAGLQCIGGTCQELSLPRIGEACTGAACAAGAWCDAGVCVALKDAGAACKLPFECRAGQCGKPPGAVSGVCADPCTPFGPASGSAR